MPVDGAQCKHCYDLSPSISSRISTAVWTIFGQWVENCFLLATTLTGDLPRSTRSRHRIDSWRALNLLANLRTCW